MHKLDQFDPMKTKTLSIFLTCFLLISCSTLKNKTPLVRLIPSPMNGIAPQVLIDSQNTVHLTIFVKNEKSDVSNSGNLYYLKKKWSEESWSNPIMINSKNNNVIYRSIISHHQMAISKDGLPHVTWFEESTGKYFYAYQKALNKGFTKARSMVNKNTVGHEAGASLAINDEGHIYFVFSSGPFDREDKRQIYFRKSINNGVTFSAEKEFSSKKYGSCACCSISANINSSQSLSVLYRSAQDLKTRDMRIIQNTNSKDDTLIDSWAVNACPVSTHYLSKNLALVIENQGHIYFKSSQNDPLIKISKHNETRNKNPYLATNKYNRTIITWGKGSGWSKGGELHYIFAKDNLELSSITNTKIKIKKYSRSSVIALPSGNFAIYY